MLEMIRAVFKPPVFKGNVEKTRRAEILHYGSIVLFLSLLILFWINIIIGTQAEKDANWLVALVALIQILIQFLIRTGRVKTASHILLFIGWVTMTEISRRVSGIHDEAIFGYVIVILASGILLGWQVTILYTFASIAAIWYLAYLETNELIHPFVGSSYRNSIDLTVVFILIFLVEYFLIRSLTNALENAQRELSERTLIEAEREELISQLSEEITERQRIQEDLQQLARTDSLTGLFNRRYFFEIAGKEFAKSIRYHRPLSVIILDLDLFKGINDTYGHIFGDQALAHIGDLLRKAVRKPDVSARYGGEEFVVLLPETDGARARIFAERFRKLLADSPIQRDNDVVYLTASIGVAGKSDNDEVETLDQLISQADQALYKAKEGGRNLVVHARE
jgi:diguanylate cyclase (GGDEF)-like protein